MGLNPFEFRAWGNTKTTRHATFQAYVLIPLNSGLGEIQDTVDAWIQIIVLIPLNSGLGEIPAERLMEL